MKNISLKKAEIISFVVASILGVIFHFVYDWSGENPIVSLFFPKNESTWEHLKLIYFPITLLAFVEYFLFHIQYQNLAVIKLLSILLAMTLTIVLFYTYTGVYGQNSDVVNIAIYFISMSVAYLFSYRMIRGGFLSGVSPQTAYWGFVILLLFFFVFTLFPPTIGLFTPPEQCCKISKFG